MTDTNAPAAAAADPSPADFVGSTNSDFDANMAEFFGRDLLSDMQIEQNPAQQQLEPGQEPQSDPAPAPADPDPVQVNPTPAAPTSPEPAPANAGTPAAPNDPLAPADASASPEVDPNLLMAMFGQGPAAPQPAPAPAPAPSPTAPAVDEEIPMPFTMDLQLPANLTQTLFNSEDPVQQERALKGLVAAIGNAAVGYMEQRIRNHHTPRIASQFAESQSAQAQAAAVAQDFYGTHKDLEPYKQVVLKAGQAWAQHNPNRAYDAKARDEVANLARAALKNMNINLPAPAAQGAAPAPAPQPAPGTAPRTPYVAGGARPGGSLEQAPADDSPGAMLDLLTQF